MKSRRRELGAVIMERYGRPSRVVPDFGYGGKVLTGERVRSWTRECAPVLVGLLLIVVLERIDLTGSPQVAQRQVPVREVVALREEGQPVRASAQLIPVSRWP